MSFENNETYKLLLKLKCVCISIIIFAFHNILCRQGQVMLLLHNEICNYSIKFLLKLKMNTLI